MRMGRELSGTWRGQYAYSQPAPLEPGDDHSRRVDMSKMGPVSFEMTMREGWMGRLEGTVTDSGPDAVPGLCALSGWKIGSIARFTKTYPGPHTLFAGKVRYVLIDRLREELGEEFCKRLSIPLHRVRYKGSLLPDGSSIHGTWSIRDLLVRIPGSIKYARFAYGTTGTWSANRLD
jgi:hypothetical protein